LVKNRAELYKYNFISKQFGELIYKSSSGPIEFLRTDSKDRYAFIRIKFFKLIRLDLRTKETKLILDVKKKNQNKGIFYHEIAYIPALDAEILAIATDSSSDFYIVDVESGEKLLQINLNVNEDQLGLTSIRKLNTVVTGSGTGQVRLINLSNLGKGDFSPDIEVLDKLDSGIRAMEVSQ